MGPPLEPVELTHSHKVIISVEYVMRIFLLHIKISLKMPELIEYFG